MYDFLMKNYFNNDFSGKIILATVEEPRNRSLRRCPRSKKKRHYFQLSVGTKRPNAIPNMLSD